VIRPVSDDSRFRVPGEFDAIACDVSDFVGDWTQLDYGDPFAPRIAALREEFALDDVAAGCATEFEGFLALKRWVRSRWNHGWSRSFGSVADALDILREAARGEQFNCGHYSTVFRACATALGWPARPVSVALADCSFPRDDRIGNVGHAIPEVWSNEHRKWVVMDPDLNVHYERDGVPLSAWEIREAWLSGQADCVNVVQDQPEFVAPTGATIEVLRETYPALATADEERVRLLCRRFTRHRAMDYYARLRIAGWEWLDRRCLPTFVSHFSPAPAGRWTSHMPDIYWTLNMVRLTTQPAWDEAGAKLTIRLQHCMPWFDHLEVSVDDGAWARCGEGLDWPMHAGVNSLQCRAVNALGRPGIATRIEVAYSPPRW